MRKNKKLLLASVAAMGALALGVGATSTFAWYQVSATATASLATPVLSGTFATKTSSLDAVDYKLQITVTAKTGDDSVVLTSWNGDTYGVVGGKIAAASAELSDKYGTLSFSYAWFDTDGTTALSAGKQAAIKAQDLYLTITPNSRTRLTLTQPGGAKQSEGTYTFAEAFGSSHSAGTALGVKQAAEGAHIVLSIPAGGTVGSITCTPVYYSVSGNSTDSASETVGNTAHDDGDTPSALGGISSIAISA